MVSVRLLELGNGIDFHRTAGGPPELSLREGEERFALFDCSALKRSNSPLPVGTWVPLCSFLGSEQTSRHGKFWTVLHRDADDQHSHGAANRHNIRRGTAFC